ncbi:D-amino-acid oxidase [Penicillium concentricum]|uniref:D-amino-acid oxidase n=1 Tax=Penicillium concentricum TaxID=293559 RepID=A0A9W9RGQ0_9EURO|nr:D-amino-acid oxidase [Penicillium concentricum]KAJ5359973.1 D-amino-acid oxidase [Penicillium concentricum]
MSQGHVIIIGAGVIGLSIAVKLSKYMKITVIARELPGDVGIDYASPWAGAHFRPTPAKTEEEQQEQAWMRHTYQEFEKIAKDYPEAGVDFIPAVEYFDTADATSFLAEENGYTTWPDFRILDPAEYRSQHPSIQLGVTYRSWVLNSPVYLKWLQTRAEAQGTRFIRAHLTDPKQAVSVYLENKSQDETGYISAVVDASGRGFNDPNSFPSRGQFIVVSNHCDKTISHHWSDGSSTVIIPRPLGGGTVIGGTKEPNNWSEDIDDASTEEILKRVRYLCPEMIDEQADELALTHGFDIKQVYVARRPMRHGGLHFVLGSSVAHDGNRIPLISCYGAGANGYKISWALADDFDRFFPPPK